MLLGGATAPHAEASEETIAEIVSLADPTGDRELSRFDEIGSAFEADDSGVAAHVTAHVSSVRVATIIEHEDAPHEFAYDIEGADLTIRADGTIEVSQIGLMISPEGTEHQEAFACWRRSLEEPGGRPPRRDRRPNRVLLRGPSI